MTRPLNTLLVANRAEIASRIIRSARSMGVATVAVFSDADEHLPYVGEADRSVRLPGRTPADTYLRADGLIAVAFAVGADALHPGYGFLSENAEFASACVAAGLTFVGPPAEAIARMGSKVSAKEVMAAAGVPVLPGAVVTATMTDIELRRAAEEIGYPVMVKASFGGGGRGMRVVREPDELVEAVASAQREAASAFGDGTVFLERCLIAPRHVEVQIVADEHGTVSALFERECSIQRRHQKIIEEAPSPALDTPLREEMCAAAVAAARAVGYQNAGTVEFVLGHDREFGFLEMNTRLQVEHPITEMITGLDLVRLQLEIARGDRLPPEAVDATMRGHAVEARLYAEDVAAGYLPVSGEIHRMRFPEHPWLRVDGGYAEGNVVTPHYDAMLAKVIAYAPTRVEAIQRLAGALVAAELHGVVTNRDLLVGILRHPEFLRGETDTGFLERHEPGDLVAAATSSATVRTHLVAAALADASDRREASPLPKGIPEGWRNVGPSSQALVLDRAGRRFEIGLFRERDGGLRAVLDGSPLAARGVGADEAAVDLELDGVRQRCRVHRVGETIYIDSPSGSSAFEVVAQFPEPETLAAGGSLRSPMPGLVVAVAAVPGRVIVAGEVLVTIEAMKMEHAIRAPADGTVVEVRAVVGAQVDTGAVLVVLEVSEAG